MICTTTSTTSHPINSNFAGPTQQLNLPRGIKIGHINVRDLLSTTKKDLMRESAVLTVQRFMGTHDAEKITDTLLNIVQRFQLQKEKITAIVTDNGANFVKAFKEYGTPLDTDEDDDEIEREEISSLAFDLLPSLPTHVRCASHTLSLCATTDIEKVRLAVIIYVVLSYAIQAWH